MAVQFTKQIQFTRPNNSTQYTAGDAVSDNATSATVATFTLSDMARAPGLGGRITNVTLHKTDQDLTGADFDIYLFDAAVAGTSFEDNAAHALTDAELQTCIGFVSLTAASHAVSGGMITGDLYSRSNLDWAYGFSGTGTSTDLYVVVIARGTYTPAANEVFTIRFGGEMD